MAETVIREAPQQVRDIATELIDEHHEHLQQARILWLTTTAKRSRGNRVVLGTSNRTTALTRYLSAQAHQPADFIVLIEERRWPTMLATQRKAFIDSLLCRMQQRETVNKRSGKITKTWVTVAPDLEEFTDVIRRHGVWLPEHQVFAKAIQEHGGKQLTLQIPDPRLEPDVEDADAEEGADGEVETADTDEAAEPQAETGTDESAAAAAEPAPNGADHSADGDWRAQTGIGASPIQVSRARRRGTASSEMQPSGAPA